MSGARRAVNLRVTPHPDVPQTDPNVCLKPNTDTHHPAWARKLSNAWHALLLKDKRHQDCHLCGVFRRQVCCFCQALSLCVPEERTLVGPQQALSQFVYKKRETVFGSRQLPPNCKAAVHVHQHSPSISEQTLRCRQRRLERVSRFLCVFAWIALWLH